MALLNNMNAQEPNHTSNEDISLGRIIRFLLMQSKLIFFTTLVAFLFSAYLYISADKEYRIKSLLQVFQSNSLGVGQQNSLDSLMGGRGIDINNLVSIYGSRSNFLEVVSSLGLNIIFEEDGVIELNSFNAFPSIEDDTSKLAFIFSEENYALYDANGELLGSAKYSEPIITDKFEISIKSSTFAKNKKHNFTLISPNSAYQNLKRELNIGTQVTSNSFYRNTGLIDVSIVTSKVELGEKIINVSNEVFLKDILTTENEKAKKAIQFIDNRMLDIGDMLDQSKNRLKQFQEKNTSINVDLEIKSIIDTVSLIEQSIFDIDIELAEAAATYTNSNPIFTNLQSQKNALINQKEQIERKIKDLPVAQQTFIDLFRDVELTQDLYAELANRKLSFSIIEASTIGNIRIVDPAFIDKKESPQIINIVIFTILVGFLMVLIAIFRGFYLIPMTNPAEISDNGITESILGVIPNYAGLEDKASEDFFNSVADNQFYQSLEGLVVNIKSLFLEDDSCKTILLTSPSPKNGKSTLSRHVARKISLLGKKTLLIDCDFKKGSQGDFFDSKKISAEEFFNISESSIEEFNLHDNLYLIPKIRKLNSSFQFVYNPQFHRKISEFKDYFDFIIIDTAPIFSVSDTSVLMTLSDLNIGVVKHGLSKINEVKQMIEIGQQIGRPFNGLIYNDFSKPSGYYGYYGLYGNYSYQYYATRYLEDEYNYTEVNKNG